jgi:hypothetical protein
MCLFLCSVRISVQKNVFNLGERNFFVRARPTEKLFLTEHTEKLKYFCVHFSDGTP